MLEFNLQPQFEQIPNVKISYNVGSLMDIPTGMYKKGQHGESILNGGLGQIIGVVGIGNNFKTTIADFMQFTVMSHFPKSSGNKYDTEVNVQESRTLQIAKRIFQEEDIIDNGRYLITDKTKYFANEWYEIWKKYIRNKVDNAKKISVFTPFLDRDKVSLLPMIYPTLTCIDSFSEFETADVAGIQDANELGDSGGNTIHMRQGLAKIRFLSDIPKFVAEGNNPLLMTAHIGKDIPMDARAAPVKKLQYLKNGDKIKGVTDKFMFLTTVCWQCQNAVPLMNDTTKGPEYPRNPDDNMKGDTDLNIVTLVLLRNKNGASGMAIQLVVSQSEGVLPGLSEFHYIKLNDRYGLNGSLQNYSLDLLPEVKLSRTTVRSKLDNDYKLQRAMNITSELCQMMRLWHDVDDKLYCTPKQLYDDLIAKGYDWNILLNTRGWWTADNDNHAIPFLTTRDLLNMRIGAYHPFWLEDDKKTIKIGKRK